MEEKIYSDKVLDDNTFIRTFDKNIHQNELLWHRDERDRIIKSLKNNDWKIQIDGCLPTNIDDEQISIPKDVYHRLIKGDGELVIMVTEL